MIRSFIIGLSILFFALSGLITFKALEIPVKNTRYQNNQKGLKSKELSSESEDVSGQYTKDQSANRVLVEESRATISNLEDEVSDKNEEAQAKEKKDTKEIKHETIETLSATNDQFVSQTINTIKTVIFFRIERFVVAGSIENREPVGIVNDVSSSTEKIYCFLEARDIKEDTAVSLVWYHGGNKMATVELAIYKGPRWRTYSSKELKGLRGDWKVELQDVNGSVLETVTFSVR
jgi:hypothetical protein